MSAPDPALMRKRLETNVKAWMSNKTTIAKGEFGHQDLMGLLKSVHPDSEGIKFKPIMSQDFDPILEKDVAVPGFKLTANMDPKQAKVLQNSIRGQGNVFPFPAKMSFTKQENGTVDVSLITDGDYTAAIMKNPRYVAAFNVESFARYAMFRGVTQYLARGAVYQFNPEGQHMPRPASMSRVVERGTGDALLVTDKTYLACNREVKHIIGETLTTLDRLGLNDHFDEGLKRPKDLHNRLTSMHLRAKPKQEEAPEINPALLNQKEPDRPSPRRP